MKPLITIVVLFCFSCGADLNTPTEVESNPSTQLSKADLIKQGSKADHAVDYCAINGWYGDGVCDAFCLHEDAQDCGSAEVKAECAQRCSIRSSVSCVFDDECLSTCEDGIASWNTQQKDDFQFCLGRPLCFDTLSNCLGDAVEEAFCKDACSNRDNQFGWCSDRECVQYCKTNSRTWDNRTEEAFLTCATEDPLCYQTIEDCVSSEKRNL